MKREEARRAVDGSVVVVLGSGVGLGGLLWREKGMERRAGWLVGYILAGHTG